ncbi:hypothetical protein K443DRAFT_133048 [Laccaria amethystina LaAM-08-1]|uniref:MYND-type domain-containing protein n=1 Tax=Laccaria amethystina LaAM-08-1 TaxID=1095629 RepID=A0A0C9WP05_9AGAR|nr:hypothetical protein K443DRAFT_133048 [Laccaria amethystina LaAM-08-1]
MDLTRSDILALLGCLKVSLPKAIKLSEEDLHKRLSQALDPSQSSDKVIAPIKPLDYGTWPTIPTSTKEEDTFTELRQILLNLGHRYDAGGRVFVLQDTQQESAIIVRLLEVRAIDDKSPLLVLLYKPVKPTPAKRLLDGISPFISPSTAIISVSTTELERKMFLELVSQNAKRVSSSYKPQRSPGEGRLHTFDLGKLSSNSGCEVCGRKREASKCTGCLAVVYCGKGGSDHKKTCRTLKGGTWLTIHFERPKGFSAIMNRHSRQNAELTDADAQMLIYDRQRSFQVYWKKYGGEDGHDGFEVRRRGRLRVAGDQAQDI